MAPKPNASNPNTSRVYDGARSLRRKFRNPLPFFGAFARDLSSWSAFSAYRRSPDVLMWSSVVAVGRLRKKTERSKPYAKLSILYLLILIPLPIAVAWYGTKGLGDEHLLAFALLVWPIILGSQEWARDHGVSELACARLFWMLTLAEVGAAAWVPHIGRHHYAPLRGALWGVVLVGSLDLTASLVTFLLRVSDGDPLLPPIADAWPHLKKLDP